jgi:hypothetical protein
LNDLEGEVPAKSLVLWFLFGGEATLAGAIHVRTNATFERYIPALHLQLNPSFRRLE